VSVKETLSNRRRHGPGLFAFVESFIAQFGGMADRKHSPVEYHSWNDPR
jgi:hypothetical protein